MPFDGLRVIAFESRRAKEIAELIRRQQGNAFVAPSMREVPLESNVEAFAFAERLFNGEFDMMILMTGVGIRALHQVLESRYPPGRFQEALRTITIVARGPKPAAVLREFQVPITVMVPEPNTWRELLTAIEARPEKRIAVQEYGKSNVEMLDALRARGAQVTPVPIYQWDLPEDTAPLHEAVQRLAHGQADVVMFTTQIQLHHLFKIAAEAGLESEVRQGLQRAVIASIGPTTTEALTDFGFTVDLEPTHPKMGFFVKETAEQATAILARKKAHAVPHAAPNA